MLPSNLPQLHILPTESLLPHEDHDASRAFPLAAHIKKQGLLRNPPIVMPLQDGTGRYVVLDGANRVTAARMLRLPHFLAQVVLPNSPQVSLHAWNHVVWGMPPEDIEKGLQDIAGESLQEFPSKEALTHLDGTRTPVPIQVPDGRVFLLHAEQSLDSLLETLHAVVNLYKGRANLDRTNLEEISHFLPIHNDLTALVFFPMLRVEDVLRATSEGKPLPAGITRFRVSPRALHVNYPLEKLEAERPLEEKEAELQEWVRGMIKQKKARYYEESTFIFNE